VYEIIQPLLKFTDHPKAERLLKAIVDAHIKADINNQNASRTITEIATKTSSSFINGICAGMLSLGGAHGPLREARWIIRHSTRENLCEMASKGVKIPGFGNDFFKDKIDPSWDEVYQVIYDDFPELHARLVDLQAGLWDADKKVYVNAAGFTAGACEILKLPDGSEEALLFFPRAIVRWFNFLAKD
jgi:citrate synthase